MSNTSNVSAVPEVASGFAGSGEPESSNTSNVFDLREVTSGFAGSGGSEPSGGGEPILRTGCTAIYGEYGYWTTELSKPNITTKTPCSIWTPTPTPREDWFIVGYHAQGNLGPPIGSTAVVSAKNETPSDPMLKAPIDWQEVWNDKHKSSGNARVAIWSPVPPDGYIGLGHVISLGCSIKPSLDIGYRCVRNDLVVPTEIGPAIWNDAGSGAMGDVTLYSIVGLPGAFVSQGNYGPYSNTVYRIKGS